jgi:glycosyltransferase involved in cell wall biosynthesis
MTGQPNAIRIAIHIDVTPGLSGGTAQSTQGLVRWLGQLEGPERYVLSVQTPEQAEWISGYRGPTQKIVFDRSTSRRQWTSSSNGSAVTSTLRDRAKATLRPSVERIRGLMGRLTPQLPTLPMSNGYYESLACDVVHFPTQPFILCALPTIYNPHDLQHLHYPQFWTPWELARRETVYRGACQFANTVVVGSQWIKDDVVRQYVVSPDKVQIIPWAPPTVQYPAIDIAEIEAVRQRLRLPETYAFYPAVTWPHKNHLRLLDAIAELRDKRGLTLNLVCSGAQDEFWPKIERRIADLNLASQVKFLGFISEADLRAVYRLAQCLVLPSLFEADSCPIHEAWSEGLPVASSNLTGLPDQVGDAGLLFDAKSVSSIADALQAMATDAELRQQLIARGHRRVGDFDWERTAKTYRAVYRRAADAMLTEEDRWLLSWDWMREPHRKLDRQEIL